MCGISEDQKDYFIALFPIKKADLMEIKSANELELSRFLEINQLLSEYSFKINKMCKIHGSEVNKYYKRIFSLLLHIHMDLFSDNFFDSRSLAKLSESRSEIFKILRRLAEME